jgi:hypothetical protein
MMRICLPVNHNICISAVIAVPETILIADTSMTYPVEAAF